MLTAVALVTLVISPGVRLVQDDAPAMELSQRSARLLEERSQLQTARPRILAPILLTTGGLAAALGGLGFIYWGLFTAIYYAFSFAAGSVVLLAIGIVLLEHEEAGMQTLLTF